MMRQVCDTGAVAGYETELITAKGRYVPVEITLGLDTDNLSRPRRINAILRDITERKQAEETLRVSEEKYRRLIENTSEGFWLISTEKKIVKVNQAFCDMLGYSEDEMIGKTPLEFVDDENRKIFKEQTSRITETTHRNYEISGILHISIKVVYSLLGKIPLNRAFSQKV